MDYFGIVREAWGVAVRERGLWRLAAVEVLHAAALITLMLAVLLPMTAVIAIAAEVESGRPLTRFSADLLGWLGANTIGVMVALVGLFVAYAAAAVLSVAAQAGIVVEAAAVLRGEGPAIAGRGLRTGFRLWWRVAAVQALPVLPSLVLLLATALVLFATISLPMMSGGNADLASVRVLLRLLSPASTLIGVLSIPLLLWSTIAVRFALLDDLPWRPALRAAWRTLRSRLQDVALMYLMLYAVTLGVSFASELAAGLVLGVFVLAGVFTGMTFGVPSGIAVAIVGAILALPILIVVMLGMGLVVSVAWTRWWSSVVEQTRATADPVVGYGAIAPEGGVS